MHDDAEGPMGEIYKDEGGKGKKDMWFQFGGGGRIYRKRMGEWPQSCRTRAFLFIEQ